MLKRIGIIMAFFVISEATSQKVLHKVLDANFIKEISIDGNGIFKIEVISEERNTIEMISEIEGEYAPSTMQTFTEIDGKLTIGSSHLPYFKKENDKLSAHKIESVSLHLRIPKGMVLYITSDIANLEMDGTYVLVDVSLENGNCTLTNFIGNANLLNSEGNINVAASGVDVSGILFSKHGTEMNELPEGNRFMIEAYSLRGNIALQETEK